MTTTGTLPDTDKPATSRRRSQSCVPRKIARLVHNNGLTDTYQAERFAAQHGRDWRFDHTRRMWVKFQEPLWRPEGPGEVKRLAIECAREYQRDARGIQDTQVRNKALGFAKFCQTLPGIHRVLGVAENLSPIAVDSSAWNRDPWLVGAPNGIVNLKTGRLVRGTRDHLISLSLGVPYDPKTQCPRWEQFLAEVFKGDDLLVRYIHRALGYLLTGLTSAQLWWLFYGDGANGKTTLLNILAHIIGEYGSTVPFSMFELHQQRSTIPDDLATLPGKRFVHASETIESKRMDEARMKMLTGSDRITARPLYGKWFEFDPTHKVVLSCNHKPVVQDDSPAYWRRVHLVPFNRRFEGADRDDHLTEKLKAEAPGILAWMVRGCLHWQAEGLNPPPIIQVATLGYRAESDHLPEFLAQCCEERPDAECPASGLHSRYQSWATEQQVPNDQRHGSRAFGERMAKRFERKDTSRGRIYKGIGLKPVPLHSAA